MARTCSVCAYPFEREPGYWTGAMIVNIAVCEVWFLVLLMTVIFATIPDVPWQPLLAVALVTNGLLPVLFYPFSKTIWMALNLHFHPLEANEG